MSRLNKVIEYMRTAEHMPQQENRVYTCISHVTSPSILKYARKDGRCPIELEYPNQAECTNCCLDKTNEFIQVMELLCLD